MEKELCPQCKSDRTVYQETGIYAGHWVCNYQGCDGKLGADKFFWKPGAGLPPKAPKKKKNSEESAKSATAK